MQIHHTSVLVREILTALNIKPRGSYIDCTVGEGGHAEAILSAVTPPPRVLGLDLDSNALESAGVRLAEYGDNVTLHQGNYSAVEELAAQHGFAPADGILLDLGLSSLQVDTGERGFSFRQEARLDMRFDPHQTVTAYEVVNQYDERELADIIYQLGEERRSRQLARAIVRSRPIETTTRLAEVIANSVGRGRRSRTHPATRTFQAIRMTVNGELENVQRGVTGAIATLGIGGRLAVISYHSLEDRLVKTTLRQEASACICPPQTPECICGHSPTIKLVNRRVIKPSREEVQANPRSRSARLRIAERI